MKSLAQIRAEARRALTGASFWRLLVAVLTLQGLVWLVSDALDRLNDGKGIVTLSRFLMRKAEALRQGLDYALPTREAYSQMWAATGFEWMATALFGSMALFGIAAVSLRILNDEQRHWHQDLFGGFRRPLSLTLLFLVQNAIVCLGLLFFVVPGLVAVYRYRLVWYLSYEHREWGVWRCLGESARLMKGVKARAFLLDLTFLLRFLPGVLSLFVGTMAMAFGGILSFLGFVAVYFAFGWFLFVILWLVLGRTVFYREVKARQRQEAGE